MVELVDDDVVELLGIERRELAGKRLNAREHESRVGSLLAAVVKPEVGIRLHPAEYISALPEDLLAMSDEQHAPELRPRRVERGKPRLSQPRCHDNQAGAVPRQAGLFERCQRLALNWPRLHRLHGRFVHLDHWRERRIDEGRVIGPEPLGSQLDAARIGPQLREAPQHRRGGLKTKIPLNPVDEPRPT